MSLDGLGSSRELLNLIRTGSTPKELERLTGLLASPAVQAVLDEPVSEFFGSSDRLPIAAHLLFNTTADTPWLEAAMQALEKAGARFDGPWVHALGESMWPVHAVLLLKKTASRMLPLLRTRQPKEPTDVNNLDTLGVMAQRWSRQSVVQGSSTVLLRNERKLMIDAALSEYPHWRTPPHVGRLWEGFLAGGHAGEVLHLLDQGVDPNELVTKMAGYEQIPAWTSIYWGGVSVPNLTLEEYARYWKKAGANPSLMSLDGRRSWGAWLMDASLEEGNRRVVSVPALLAHLGYDWLAGEAGHRIVDKGLYARVMSDLKPWPTEQSRWRAAVLDTTWGPSDEAGPSPRL